MAMCYARGAVLLVASLHIWVATAPSTASCIDSGLGFARHAYGDRQSNGDWRPRAEASVSSVSACLSACCTNDNCTGFDYDKDASECYLLYIPTQNLALPHRSVGSCQEACSSDSATVLSEEDSPQAGQCVWFHETFRQGCEHYTLKGNAGADTWLQWWIRALGYDAPRNLYDHVETERPKQTQAVF
jgi:hypothetical protein